MLHPNGRFGLASVSWQLLLAVRWDVLVALLLTLICHYVPPEVERRLSPAVLLPVVGISVSVFTAFRNTQAFQRWWDARTHWAWLVNACREWRDGLLALWPSHGDALLWQTLLQQQVLLAWLMNRELRGGALRCSRQRAAQLLETLQLPEHCSSSDVQQLQARGIAQLVQQGFINDGPSRLVLFNAHGRMLTAIGGLERIQQQPMPPSYGLFIRLIVWVFGMLLYLRLDELSTPHWSAVGFLCLLGFVIAERLGALLEDPFTNPVFGLAMDHICCGISADLLGAEHPLAQPPQSPKAQIWT